MPDQTDQAIMVKLIELCAFLGVRPLSGETPADFGKRALVALDRRIQFLDGNVRTELIAAISRGAS